MRMALLSFFWDMEMKHPTRHRILTAEPPTTPAYGVLPEPGTLGLMGTGLLGLVGLLRRKLLR